MDVPLRQMMNCHPLVSAALPLAIRTAPERYLTAENRGCMRYTWDWDPVTVGKNLFLPKHWASPINWRLKTILQNNWWFHQMYRELKGEMSILLDKRSRRTERETVKYINCRLSERVSGNILHFQKTFFIIPKSHVRQLWQSLAGFSCWKQLQVTKKSALSQACNISTHKNLYYSRKTSPPSSEPWGMCF